MAAGSGDGTNNTKLYNKLDFIVALQTTGQKGTPISIVHTDIFNASVGRNTLKLLTICVITYGTMLLWILNCQFLNSAGKCRSSVFLKLRCHIFIYLKMYSGP